MEGAQLRQASELGQRDVTPIVSLDVVGGSPYRDTIPRHLCTRRRRTRVSHDEQRRGADGPRFPFERMARLLERMMQRAKCAGEQRIIDDRLNEDGLWGRACANSSD